MTARTERQRPGTPIWRDFWTSDPEGTAEFFRTLFSKDVEPGLIALDVPEGNPEMGGYTTAQLGGRHVFGIGPAMPGGGDVAAVFLATDDADATHAKALELGATEKIGPTTVEGHGRFSAVTDPTGALVAFYESHGMLGYGAVDELGFPCWQDLLTPDVAAAEAFYGELFGLTFDHQMAPYSVAQLGQDGLFGFGPLEAGEEALWVQYALVPRLEPVLAKAKELGAGQVGEVMELGFGRSAHLTTPAGAAFGLFEGSEEMRAEMEEG
ncbi:VOC family protein [Kytococcus sedentarius]|uniref:VOC family protein n=1 Tax=Kytococcus sedentarius TaxID=1276 RepID=UPI0035BC7FF5